LRGPPLSGEGDAWPDQTGQDELGAWAGEREADESAGRASPAEPHDSGHREAMRRVARWKTPCAWAGDDDKVQ
jgi:hypothetical protein